VIGQRRARRGGDKVLGLHLGFTAPPGPYDITDLFCDISSSLSGSLEVRASEVQLLFRFALAECYWQKVELLRAVHLDRVIIFHYNLDISKN
jgi:hypothetical protein